jgi:hypothetical protein
VKRLWLGVPLCLLALRADAVVTATWTVETYQQFDAGDATSAFITSTGELRPGWDTKRVKLEGDAVWSALRLADGSTLLGSDVGGAIYKVTGDSSKQFTKLAGAIAVVSLAQTSDGTIWAGAMPGNKIWKIDATGKATAGPALKDVETIWSLVAAGNTVYAGTGPSGKLFSISGNSAKEVFDSEDKRITAVTVTSDGAIWMGTSERALVFRYDPKAGKTRAMADFAGNEVTAIAPYRTGVVVAANDLAEVVPPTGKTPAQVEAAEKPTAAKGQAAKTPDVGTKPGADKDPTPVTDLGRKGAKKGKGALFRVGGDGRLDQLHALTATYFTSVAVAADGTVYAGAADKGRVYMVDNDDAVGTAFDVDERAVSQLWLEKNMLGFATDDAAALYRATGRASQAKYMSDVLDAKAVARFGKLTWISQGKVKVETRSGNTAKPGVGWSEWQSPTQIGKLGGGVDGGKIASPPGRYLQFRTSLEDDSARVRRVMTYYVPQNSATEIQEVTVESTKENMPTLKDLAAKPRSPILKLKWKVENPDADDTVYTLEARRDGEANWRPLQTGKTPLTATTWEWNTETYPDGWYKLRVTGSDQAANSPDRALTSSKMSTLFAIDNTRPVIDGLSINYGKGAVAKAKDQISTIAEMAFSVDDQPWQLGTTADGLFDDLSEDLRIDLPPGLPRGTHTLAVRVADSAGNVGSTSATFVVK